MAPQVPLPFPNNHTQPRPLTATTQKSLRETAKENPSQIGDPVSLKAETSNTRPTKDDLGAKGGDSNDGKSLKQIAQDKMDKGNPSQIGDPVSLKAETSDTEVTKDDRGALGTSKTDGKPKM